MTPRRASNLPAVIILFTGMAAAVVPAQVAVTSVSYGARQNDWNQSQGGIVFRNESYAVDSIGTEAGDYTMSGPMAQDVYVRRNTSWWNSNPNYTTLFYQIDHHDRAYGTTPSTVEDVFLSGNLFSGIRDPFANTGSSTYSQNSNIERIDFFFGDYVVEEGAGIILFDLENAGNFGDAFRIAAFTGWDSSAAAPDLYANTGLLIAPDSYGGPLLSPTDNGSTEFGRATYGDGDDVSGSAYNFTPLADDLAMVGILIRFTDMGLQVGQTINGFSLMASDVNVTVASDLVNWNNAAVYRTDTDRNTHGNIDFMGFGGQIANAVPEPSTYGAWFIGLLGAAYALRVRRQRRHALKPTA